MLLLSGLWLRAGLIGAGALVVGVSGLIDGPLDTMSALALSIGGGALTILGAQRVRAVLDEVDMTAGPSSAADAPEHRTRADAAQHFAGVRPKLPA